MKVYNSKTQTIETLQVGKLTKDGKEKYLFFTTSGQIEGLDENNQRYLYIVQEQNLKSNVEKELTVFETIQENGVLDDPFYKITYSKVYKQLDIAKNIKCNQINTQKNKLINDGFTYNGKVYDSDNNSKLNILGKLIELQINTSDDNVLWIAKDNTITRFTKVDFITFANSLVNFIELKIFNTRNLKDKINNYDNIEAVINEEIII